MFRIGPGTMFVTLSDVVYNYGGRKDNDVSVNVKNK